MPFIVPLGWFAEARDRRASSFAPSRIFRATSSWRTKTHIFLMRGTFGRHSMWAVRLMLRRKVSRFQWYRYLRTSYGKVAVAGHKKSLKFQQDFAQQHLATVYTVVCTLPYTYPAADLIRSDPILRERTCAWRHLRVAMVDKSDSDETSLSSERASPLLSGYIRRERRKETNIQRDYTLKWVCGWIKIDDVWRQSRDCASGYILNFRSLDNSKHLCALLYTFKFSSIFRIYMYERYFVPVQHYSFIVWRKMQQFRMHGCFRGIKICISL